MIKIVASPGDAKRVMDSQSASAKSIAESVAKACSDGAYREAYRILPGLKEMVDALFTNVEAYVEQMPVSTVATRHGGN